MQSILSAVVVGVVLWCAGRGYHTPLIPVDDGLYSSPSSLPHMRQREALRTEIPTPATLINAHKMGPP